MKVVAVWVVNGVSVGYVIEDEDEHRKFDSWRRKTMIRLVRDEIRCLRERQPDPCDAEEATRVAMGRLMCLPASSRAIFASNQAYLLTRNGGMIGVTAVKNTDDLSEYLTSQRPFDTYRNFEIARDSIEEAILSHAERQELPIDWVRAAGVWMADANMSNLDLVAKIDRVKPALAAHKPATDADARAPEWSSLPNTYEIRSA